MEGRDDALVFGGLSRRLFLSSVASAPLAIGALGGMGTLVLASSSSLQKNEQLNEGNSPMNDSDLRSDDPTLSQRARELIRIGESGIATENAEAVKTFYHPDFRFHGTDGSTLNREELWVLFAAYRTAFDGFKVTRQQIFSDGGENVAARTTFSGVFAHPLTMPPVGRIEPHGRSISYMINNVFRYAPDGRLIDEWAQYDSRLFLKSLGVELVAKK